jgi:hypothetical protein
LVSAISAALSVIVLCRIMVFTGTNPIFLPIICLGGGIAELARIVTPDSTAVLFGLLCLLAALRASYLSFVFAAVLPLIRTDLVILSALVASLEVSRGKIRWAAASLAGSAIAYMFANKISGNYGLLTLINFCNKRTPYPSHLGYSSSVAFYLKLYATQLCNFASSLQFVILMLLAYLGISNLKPTPKAAAFTTLKVSVRKLIGNDMSLIVYAIPVMLAAFHILAFPYYEPRYFTLSTVVILVGLFRINAATEAADDRRPVAAPLNQRRAGSAVGLS